MLCFVCVNPVGKHAMHGRSSRWLHRAHRASVAQRTRCSAIPTDVQAFRSDWRSAPSSLARTAQQRLRLTYGGEWLLCKAFSNKAVPRGSTRCALILQGVVPFRGHELYKQVANADSRQIRYKGCFTDGGVDELRDCHWVSVTFDCQSWSTGPGRNRIDSIYCVCRSTTCSVQITGTAFAAI